jgi:hypothetical protein
LTQSKNSTELVENIQNLEDKILFLQEKQTSCMHSLDQAVNFNLYTTLEFDDYKNTNSAFDVRNIELFEDPRMSQRLKGFAEIEFERTAKANSGPRKVEVEQGWLEYSIKSYFNSRFGIVLVAFEKYNLYYFDTFRDLIDSPIPMRRVIQTAWAEVGADFVGYYH